MAAARADMSDRADPDDEVDLVVSLATVVGIIDQGSRMSLVGDDLEHVVVVPGGPLAPAA
jgi:hypothetical protein